MKIEEFIDEYKNATDKDTFIKEHILIDKYIKFLEKIATCKKIIDTTMYVDVQGKKIFKKNTVMQNAIFELTVINTYTDIDIEFENGIWTMYYDKLSEFDLINILLENIPECEFTSWNMILCTLCEDEITNTRNVLSFLESKSDAIDFFKNILIQSFTSTVDNADETNIDNN